MNARHLLSRKGSTDVQTISATSTLAHAASVLASKRIGCLVVVDDRDDVCGIISERDIVRVIGENGQQALESLVEAAMTRDVKTCSLETTDTEMLGVMTIGRFRHVPIMDGSTREGLISIGDVVKARIEALERDNEALETMIRSATA